MTNPCDLCTKKCSDTECALHQYARENYCEQYDCFINYEGSCLLSLYENCGAWE